MFYQPMNNIVSHYLQAESYKLDEVCKLIMSESEWVWHISCWYNTLQEVWTLQHQLQETTDEKTRKNLQEKMAIVQARKELAHSKYVRS